MRKISIAIIISISFHSLGLSQNIETVGGFPAEQQRQGNLMAGIAFDVIKSDFKDRIGNKHQAALELNYFFYQSLSGTLGTEVWTEGGSTLSGVVGFRYYPIKSIFIRGRGLIGVNDLSLGAGFLRMISEKWAAEGMVDIYLEGDVALRFGMTYLFVERIYRKR